MLIANICLAYLLIAQLFVFKDMVDDVQWSILDSSYGVVFNVHWLPI